MRRIIFIYIFFAIISSIPPIASTPSVVCTLFFLSFFLLILSNEIAARRISGIFMIKNSSPVLRWVVFVKPVLLMISEKKSASEYRLEDPTVARRCNIIAAFNYFDFSHSSPFPLPLLSSCSSSHRRRFTFVGNSSNELDKNQLSRAHPSNDLRVSLQFIARSPDRRKKSSLNYHQARTRSPLIYIDFCVEIKLPVTRIRTSDINNLIGC